VEALIGWPAYLISLRSERVQEKDTRETGLQQEIHVLTLPQGFHNFPKRPRPARKHKMSKALETRKEFFFNSTLFFLLCSLRSKARL